MLTNFYPIQFNFNDGQYDIQYVIGDYKLLEELRTAYNETHSFFKIGDKIYISNHCGIDLQIRQKIQYAKKSIYEDTKVTAALIKHVFFRTFSEYTPNTRKALNFYPFRINSRKPESDIIRHVLPNNLKDKISYRKQLEVQLRTIEVNKKTQFGFVINMPYQWTFDINCHDLHQEKFNLKDVEVLHSQIHLASASVLAPRQSFIGIIKRLKKRKTDGESIGVIETNEGLKEIPLKELFLQKTKKNVANYLELVGSKKLANNVLNVITSQKSQLLNLRYIQNEIQIFSTWLTESSQKEIRQYKNKDGFHFTIEKNPLSFVNSFSLSSPTFIYSPDRTKTCKYKDLGLR